MDYLGDYTDAAAAHAALCRAVAAAANGDINLVSPGEAVYGIPWGSVVSIRAQRTAPLVGGKSPSIYQVRGAGQDTYGPTKEFIRVLKDAARIRWLSTERTDDGADPCIWAIQVVVSKPTLDDVGGALPTSASFELDLRAVIGEGGKVTDASPAAWAALGKDINIGNLDKARFNAPQVAESRAMSRAIVDALGIKRGYALAQIQKPWVIVALAPRVTDAMIGMLSQDAKDHVIAAQLGVALLALYGKRKAPAHAEPPMADPSEDTNSPTTDTRPTPAASSSNAPPTSSSSKPLASSPATPAVPTSSEGDAPATREQKLELRRLIDVLGEANGVPNFVIIANRVLARTDFKTAELRTVSAVVAAALIGAAMAVEKTGDLGDDAEIPF